MRVTKNSVNIKRQSATILKGKKTSRVAIKGKEKTNVQKMANILFNTDGSFKIICDYILQEWVCETREDDVSHVNVTKYREI